MAFAHGAPEHGSVSIYVGNRDERRGSTPPTRTSSHVLGGWIGGKRETGEERGCSQSRVCIRAGTRGRNALVGRNVARGGFGCRTAGSDVLDVHQWASLSVDRCRVELEESYLGILPRLFVGYARSEQR